MDEITKTIIEKHAAWSRNESGGERANLRGASLRGADLRRAVGLFAVGSFGRHQAIAAGGYISIGCERWPYAHWLEHYREIGEESNYSAAEIDRYGAWIKMVVEWLSVAETEQARGNS